MKEYNRIMLGAKSIYAEKCLNENFIGADYGIRQDIKEHLFDNWRDFNKKFIPIWMENDPGRSKVAAGLACGMLWTVCKGLNKGDVVLSPDGGGNYYVGEITGGYFYQPGEILPHRRPIKWYNRTISRTDMSLELKNSTGSVGTTCNITKYAAEIEKLIGDTALPTIVSTDETVEDPNVFALEKHLEEFLIKNWKHTLLGKKYDIYEEEGELVGQQYPSDTGNMDILAISKDKKELLIVELKKGRASDVVVGQIQRYMGYVQDELLEKGQTVKGVIIALEDDIRLRRALSVAPNIEFYRYKVRFELYK